MSLFAALTAFWLAAGTPAAPASPPAVCGPQDAAARQAVVDEIDQARTAAGLEVLTTDARLCSVAQRRAEEIAASGSVDSDSRSISTVSRRLFAKGYAPYRWIERAILGFDSPAAMVRNWSRATGSSYRDSVLGPYEDVGVGVADGDSGKAVAILFAVPKLSEEHRLAAPLADLAQVRKIALEQVEKARHEAGVPPVHENAVLDDVAQRQAEDMLHRGYYSHTSPEGTGPADRLEQSVYGPYRFVAENIAKGIFEPDEVVDRWMASRHHRENILFPLARDTGLGVAFGDTQDGFEVLWVQLFARRMN